MPDTEEGKSLTSTQFARQECVARANTAPESEICDKGWFPPTSWNEPETPIDMHQTCQRCGRGVAILFHSGINALTLSGVLYAPDMFVSLSHSMVRAKGCYCHGWREKLYRAADDLELAYTPDIDGVPNLLQVEDENDLLSAVRAMSFVLQHGSHSSHVPPTRKELHETFGHTDVNQLRKLAATTTCIEPANTSRFACEVCMISNSRLQISRVVPDRATRLFQRVHVDLAGPISPPGLNGERYWSLYTDDVVCHRSIDLSPAKEGFGRSLIDYIVTVKTQYGV
ncbi:hypothetical protein HBI37_225470 [Parastagonospora nodorum]|nr:hypothetical protein HBI68_221580 [Parastagonospora nodorum]KAH6323754.1 hypothetical protein HBI37_225470 [Parastagonospora nodorum]KAH6383552.1 hypothetical protein HBI08_213160 [Parastagonospora nodorum]KAH6445312.1 hypothetical protein HBI57_233500 [Parastagonospora nodorum]KAH6453208.1 hypothetical protein HBI58_207180 [Parastagonospora nodorum]